VLPFVAEAGTKARPRVVRPAGEAGPARIDGPDGFRFDLPTPAPGRRADAVTLPTTGSYSLVVEPGSGPARATLSVGLTPPSRTQSVDVRARRGARFVGRQVGPDGGDVTVGSLDDDEIAAVDVPGAAVRLPAGALPLPTPVGVGAAAGLRDPDGATSLAGVPVEFTGTTGTITPAATITIPYDTGAFDGDDVAVLTRDDAGDVTQVTAPLDVDAESGTVSFPASHFSSYAVFGPPKDLAASPSALLFANVVRAADGTVYVATPTRIYRRDADPETFTLFAGGGASRADGTDRLDFDFDAIEQLAAARDGGLLVIESSFSGGALGPDVVLRIDAAGAVRRIAGNGSAEFVPGAPALETGLPAVGSVAEDAAGHVYLGTETVAFDAEGHGLDVVLRVGAATGRIDVVAGGGTLQDPAGATPRDASLIAVESLTTDSAGRLVAADALGVFRFDFALDRAERIAGTTVLELIRRAGYDADEFFAALDRAPNGLGSSVRNVRFEFLRSVAFDPARDEILYATDAKAGLVWRLDLVRDRAFIVAGRYTRDPTVPPAPDAGTGTPGPTDVELSMPWSVAVSGREVLFVEFGTATLRSLRPRPR
jgi:hypothetical protein